MRPSVYRVDTLSGGDLLVYLCYSNHGVTGSTLEQVHKKSSPKGSTDCQNTGCIMMMHFSEIIRFINSNNGPLLSHGCLQRICKVVKILLWAVAAFASICFYAAVSIFCFV